MFGVSDSPEGISRWITMSWNTLLISSECWKKRLKTRRSNNSELLTITSTYVPSHHRFIQQPLNKSTFPAGFTPLPFPNYGNAFSQNAQIDAYLKALTKSDASTPTVGNGIICLLLTVWSQVVSNKLIEKYLNLFYRMIISLIRYIFFTLLYIKYNINEVFLKLFVINV